MGDGSGDASKFGSTRFSLPSGTTIQPDQSYTFNFTMTAPSTAGTYHPAYQMVWEYDAWYGDTLSRSVNVIQPMPDSMLISYNLPDSLESGQSYVASVTMKNTGNCPWSEDSRIRLGAVGDGSGDAYKFSSHRFTINPGFIVLPNQSYTFNFNMTGPYTAGTYHPAYQMVWDGHQWFGEVDTKTVTVPMLVNAQVVSNNMPNSMVEGQRATVSITMKNTGNVPWSEASQFRLGAVGDGSGDASKFAPIRIQISPGTVVQPGQNYTWNFDIVAPSAGTYYPTYQMVWEDHQWFGMSVTKVVTVVAIAPNATIVGATYNSSMAAGQLYNVSITMMNSGTMNWTYDTFRLGGVGDGLGDAYKFGGCRYSMAPGTIVHPGESYIWNFTVTAPAAGTYRPSYQMVWEGHQWFGNVLCVMVNVS